MLGKKGILNSVFAVMIILVVFAFASILSITVWNEFNSGIQSLDETVADNSTKEQISDLGTYVGWADDLFSFLIVVLIVGLLVTSFTLPAESYWILIVYFMLLLLFTVIAMFLSNSWTVLVNQPSLIASLDSLPFTDFVLRTFPYIVFFTGLLSGLIFYLRARNDSGVTGGFGGEDF